MDANAPRGGGSGRRTAALGAAVVGLVVVVAIASRGSRPSERIGEHRPSEGLVDAAVSLFVVGLGVLYERTQDDPHVRHLFVGLAAAAAGLLIAMAVRIVLPLWRDPAAAAVAVLGFIAIAFLRTPLLPTMLVLTPLGVAAAMHAMRRNERKKNNGASR